MQSLTFLWFQLQMTKQYLEMKRATTQDFAAETALG